MLTINLVFSILSQIFKQKRQSHIKYRWRSTLYDNKFAFDDQTLTFLTCVNNYYSSDETSRYLNGYYNQSINFNFNKNNLRGLAWNKMGKMISDVCYVCSSLDLKSTFGTKGNFFNFKFNTRTPRRLGKTRQLWFGVTHGDEMEYVFGVPFLKDWFMVDDRIMSARIMNFWANFARSRKL